MPGALQPQPAAAGARGWEQRGGGPGGGIRVQTSGPELRSPFSSSPGGLQLSLPLFGRGFFRNLDVRSVIRFYPPLELQFPLHSPCIFGPTPSPSLSLHPHPVRIPPTSALWGGWGSWVGSATLSLMWSWTNSWFSIVLSVNWVQSCFSCRQTRYCTGQL